jgi:hypothetical protein
MSGRAEAARSKSMSVSLENRSLIVVLFKLVGD